MQIALSTTSICESICVWFSGSFSTLSQEVFPILKYPIPELSKMHTPVNLKLYINSYYRKKTDTHNVNQRNRLSSGNVG